jgi:dTDP-4-dehydrorhamnose reductase
MQKRILISGSTGQLGSELKSISSDYNDFEFIFKNRNGLDLSDSKKVQEVFSNNKYDYFINTAAYTAVDKAETEKESCFDINAHSLKTIANYCNPECRIIHISSDYVYNINPGRPLQEDDTTNPLGIYAQSKLQGEEILLHERENSIILRTSWVYSEFGHNFVKTMVRLGELNDKLSIVSDQIGTPSYAREIAKCIMTIVQKIEENEDTNRYGGIYNFSHKGSTNWADFAREIFLLNQINCEVENTTTAAYNAPAHRPLWSVMSMSKIEKTFGIKIKDWKDCLQDCLSRLS